MERQHTHLTRRTSPDTPQHTRETRASSGVPLGSRLSPRASAIIEPAFAHTFSKVRVHDDAESDALLADNAARAMTAGDHIYFRPGEATFDSIGGLHVLAHELTHVVQQTRGTDAESERPRRGEPDDAFERAAAETANAVIAGEDTPAPTTSHAGVPAAQFLFDFDDVFNSIDFAPSVAPHARGTGGIFAGLNGFADRYDGTPRGTDVPLPREGSARGGLGTLERLWDAPALPFDLRNPLRGWGTQPGPEPSPDGTWEQAPSWERGTDENDPRWEELLRPYR
jgi:hypothetical protein